MAMEVEMLDMENVELRESGVMIFSGSDHDCDIENLHHGFLVARGVIPGDWEKTGSELTTFYSEISYSNGISLDMDKRSVRAYQTGSLKLGERNEPVEFMIKYLKFVEKDTFEDSMLRWDLVALHENPDEWIGGKVIHPNIMKSEWDALRSNTTFHVQVEGLDLIFVLSAQHVEQDEGEDQKAVNISCGVRKRDFEDNDELIEWLSNWREQEVFTLDVLESLLGVGDD